MLKFLPLMLALSVLLSGCITVIEDGGNPEIKSFEASPQEVQSGQPVMLHWEVVNDSSVTIEPGIGKVDSEGSQQVIVTSPVTYTITANNRYGTTSKTLDIKVASGAGSLPQLPSLQGATPSGSIGGINPPGSNIPPGTPVSPYMAGFAAPYMVSPLHADKEYINPGEAVLLTWRARNATSLQISDDLGNTYNVPPNKGGLFVFPNLYRTYIYTLTATNPAGSISESTKVTVDSFDHSDRSEGGGIVRPELTSLWFSETTIKQGDSVWLFWNTRSANFVSLWDSLTGTNWEKEGKEARYRERVYGERQLTPPASVSFYVIFENQYMSLWQGGLGISVLPK